MAKKYERKNKRRLDFEKIRKWGYNMNDKMVRVKEVMEITKYGQTKSYEIIKDVKVKYKLSYDGALAPERLLRKYLGLDKV